MSSTSLYTTFGNEIKTAFTQNTLIAYVDNATIKFPLPEASVTELSQLVDYEAIDPTELQVVQTKLQSIGFGIPSARAMASILIQVAREQQVSAMEYFAVNEASLKLAVDTYKTINMLRPPGNRIGIAAAQDNSRSRYRRLIQP